MSEALAVGLAQVNPVVGDIDGNVERIRAMRRAAGGEDLLVFGELTLAGYPPEDLVLKRAFQDRIEQAARALAADTADGGPALLIGAPWRWRGGLYNAALLLDRRGYHGGAAEARSAELRRVRREAGVRLGAAAGSGRVSRRAAGGDDLRGYVGADRCRAPARARRRAAGRAERLAVRDGQAGGAAGAGGRRAPARPACR